MAVTYSSFVLKFPEFATADVPEQTRISGFISDAIKEVNEDSWGDKTDLGVSYLAAHHLALANRTKDAAGGPVASGALESAKVGKLAVKFSGPPGSGAGGDVIMVGLAATPYGLVYAELRSTLSITPLSI